MGGKTQLEIETLNIVLLKSSNIFVVIKVTKFYLIANLFQMEKLDTFILKQICPKKGA